MTVAPYRPERLRQMQVLLGLLLFLAGLLMSYSLLLVVGTREQRGLVLLVLMLPSLVVAALSFWALRLLRDGIPLGRWLTAATGFVAALLGLLLAQTPGLLFGVIGILTLTVALISGGNSPETSEAPPGQSP